MLKQVVLFQTHLLNRSILREFAAIQEGFKDFGEAVLLVDATNTPLGKAPSSANVYPYTYDELVGLGYPMIGKTIVPGHSHFAVMKYYRANSYYDRYWVLEYDVRFSGRWADFFDKWDRVDADLLTSRITTQDQEPDWPRWAIFSPDGIRQTNPLVRSFNPFFRLSNRGAELMNRRQSDGWSGHYEALLPTLIHSAGLTMVDVAGAENLPASQWAPPPGVTPSCTTEEPNARGYVGEGTMRDMPTFAGPGPLHNMLYHPVKPIKYWMLSVYRRVLNRLRKSISK